MPSRASGASWTGPQRWTLFVTILGSSLAFVDGTVVNVALNALQRAFDAQTTAVVWVVNAYTLALAATLLLGGALGDRLGLRRVFTFGTVGFTVASCLCAAAPSLDILIAARVLQGTGAALLIPTSLALLDASFPPAGRVRAVGWWSAATSAVNVLGPSIGGWLVDLHAWRAVFLINVPLALMVLIGVRRVPESLPREDGTRLDLPGAALAALALTALTLALLGGGVTGTGRTLLLIGAAVTFVGFFVWEGRTASPMLPLRLFRSTAFSGGNVLTFLLYGALSATLLYLPLVFIRVQGYTAGMAGVALLPFSVPLAVLSGVIGLLSSRVPVRALLTAGPILTGIGFVTLGSVGVNADYRTHVLPALLLMGVGMAVVVAPLTSAVLGAAPVADAGVASAVNNAVSRVGGVVIVAALTLVMLTTFERSLERRLEATAVPEDARRQFVAQVSKLSDDVIPASLGRDAARVARLTVREAFADGFQALCVGAGALAALGGVVGALTLAGTGARARKG
ncbi:MFS transporter [Deinococcus pimensis]|uniref:MFS transporter n=1 Tax=Deinococcus pimensis TaxID=309888 RepID=UPI0004BB5B41|nr:MFS transporter [Deinococcus pimensis]